MAYGRRGIGDWIPTGGEGRALVEVKGRVGKTKGSYRRTASRFNAMRRGRLARKPQIWIPLASGDQSLLNNRREQVWARRETVGSVSEGIPDQGWLFVISPEEVGGANDPTVVAFGGEADPDMEYKVVGITGRLTWTPMDSLSDPNTDPTAWSGFVRTAWVKVHSVPQEAGSGKALYPWSGSWTDPADSTGAHVSSIFPYYDTASVDTELNQRALAERDGRWRTDVIRRYERTFVMDYMPMVYYDAGDGTPQFSYLPRANRPIQIPLPRKLVCNVGRGQALACAFQVVSQSNFPTGSAPTGVFDFSDVKVKVFAAI